MQTKHGKAIILGILVAIGATVASASWTAPTVSPPGGNAFPPLNTSSVSQAKQGGLGVGAFLSTDTAWFLGDVSYGCDASVCGTDYTPDVYVQELKNGTNTIVPVCVDGLSGKLVICP